MENVAGNHYRIYWYYLSITQPDSWNFNKDALTFVFASILFATIDILNKKYVIKEPMLCMLFYSTLTSAILTLLPASYIWITPTFHELVLLFVLGIGGNLILYFLLKSLKLINASLLAPFRYIELLISIAVGYIIFNELPSMNSYLSVALIIPCSLFIIYRQGSQKA